MEWDTNTPMDGLAWATEGLWCDADTIFTAVFGIIDNGSRKACIRCGQSS